MATDGPDPPPCDPEIFNSGAVVFMSSSIPSNAFEGWVRKVAELSGQPVDWHFFAGRACVKALGDVDRVRQVIEQLKDEHDELRAAHVEKMFADLGIKNPLR